ncbi:hypothetical protein HALTITAN_3111 [Vreelandella titanicae BH1]|uniref:Uncharacterized protein n=1 Tax=Vreelandella titanicae BH1 TaxID=1204738 RepID=L9U5V8_9GAMM|nr:hypothetical protein HALTITAN_3111 [Halomonas titanicae BH1]
MTRAISALPNQPTHNKLITSNTVCECIYMYRVFQHQSHYFDRRLAIYSGHTGDQTQLMTRMTCLSGGFFHQHFLFCSQHDNDASPHVSPSPLSLNKISRHLLVQSNRFPIPQEMVFVSNTLSVRMKHGCRSPLDRAL